MEKIEVVLRTIDALSERAGKFFSWFAGIIVLITLYEVVLRYVFIRPTIWAFDTSTMLWGAYFVTLAAWTHKEGGHIRVDVIYGRLPLRVRLILDMVLCLALCFTWVGALIMGGIDIAAESWRLKEKIAPPFTAPLYPLKTMLPIGFSLLALQCVAGFVRDLITLTKTKGQI